MVRRIGVWGERDLRGRDNEKRGVSRKERGIEKKENKDMDLEGKEK